MKQQYTSAGTSINAVKLPVIYKKLQAKGLFDGAAVLDYGCGKYTTHLEVYAYCYGAKEWAGYDKYNQDEEKNNEALAGWYDFAIISNVLNVVKEEEIIKDIISDALDHAKTAYISIYEGDKTGEGKATQNGQSWQRNEKKAAYITLLQSMGYNVQKWAGLLRVTH